MKPIQDEIFSTIDTIQGEPFSGVSDTNIVRVIGLKDAARRIRIHNKIHFAKERNSLIITEILESCARLLEDIEDGKLQYVKHAEWKINCDGYYPYCSNCMSEPPGRKMTDFCPNCGAKMKED